MKHILVLCLSILLTACGGGGGGSSSQNIVLCSLPPPSTVPNSYNGNNAIPTPTQRLNTTINRSIGLKDYNPNGNCATYTNQSYIATLDKLRNLNVDRIWIYNYGPWDNFLNSTWTVSESDWQISKTQLKYIVDEARKRNIDVHLAWQFSAYDKVGNVLTNGDPVNQVRLQQMLDSYHTLIVNVARYGESIGLKGIGLDWNAFFIQNKSMYQSVWDTNMISIANDIRSVFTGKLIYGLSSNPDSSVQVYNLVDEVVLSLAPTITQNELINISLPLMKDKFVSEIQRLVNTVPANTPIQWEIAIQSKYDYFVTGWVEDGFCVNNCIQNTYTTDFSIQALGVEAVLQAIASQTQVTTKTVNFGTSYWHTDTLTPGNEGFPNISQSIRGKPAENIVKYWFGR